MNSVHEPCPKIDSGTVLSQNWVKQAECTKCTACWPSLHAQAACLCCPMSRPWRAPCDVPHALCRDPAPRASACAPCSSAQPPRAQRPRAQRLSNAQMGSSPFQVLHHFFFLISSSLLATPYMQWLEHCNSYTQ